MGGLLELLLQHCLESVTAIKEREAAKVRGSCDRYWKAMMLIDLANPTRFLSLTARQLPFLAAATTILLLIGLYLSAAAHLANFRNKLSDLIKLESILAETVAQCSDGATPDCPVLDILDAGRQAT